MGLCQKNHKGGGFHYHCCLKLSGVKKWLSIKNRLFSKYNINVNFSDSHNHYISAYRYICKEDSEVYHSQAHPDLSEVGSPRTKTCIVAYRQNHKRKAAMTAADTPCSSKCFKGSRRQSLTNMEVAGYIVQN